MKKKLSHEKVVSVQKIDTELTPKRGETIAFEVLCRPKSGAALPEMMGGLSVDTLDQCTPDTRTKDDVARTLQTLGFRVFEVEAGTSVSAQGPYDLFQKVFHCLAKTRPNPQGRRSGALLRVFRYRGGCTPAQRSQCSRGALRSDSAAAHFFPISVASAGKVFSFACARGRRNAHERIRHPPPRHTVRPARHRGGGKDCDAGYRFFCSSLFQGARLPVKPRRSRGCHTPGIHRPKRPWNR